MPVSLRLPLIVLLSMWTGAAAVAATTSSEKKSGKTEAPPKKDTPAKAEEKTNVPTPAAVSTVSIEDISGFAKYPKQIQSLVQSAMALTRLELGYLYGSHDPTKGGMDCSGTVYHTLHFQGLKDVPRQSDEMCNWVEKKTQLHLTPTATSFDSDEFDALKPGDLLFWTNTTETKRKLPVTHVMIYLGKLKKNGKRVVFGASDGRYFQGERHSGVSVFDFSLPRAESPSHFYGYGAVPGLLPEEPKPVIVVVAPKPAEKTPVVEKPAPKTEAKPAEPKEEVRKAVAIVSEAKPESKTEPAAKTTSAKPEDKDEVKKATVAEAKPKTSTITKPKTTTTKKKITTTSTTTKRRTPAPPPKSTFERKVDQAVSSIRRFFRN